MPARFIVTASKLSFSVQKLYSYVYNLYSNVSKPILKFISFVNYNKCCLLVVLPFCSPTLSSTTREGLHQVKEEYKLFPTEAEFQALQIYYFDTRVLQKVLSLGSDYFSATFYQTYFYYKPSKYSPFTETHFCNLFT